MPVCLCSYRGVSEQEQCKKLHLPHSQLTAEAPSKVLPVVMVSATPLSSLFSLPHVYTPLRWLCSPNDLWSYCRSPNSLIQEVWEPQSSQNWGPASSVLPWQEELLQGMTWFWSQELRGSSWTTFWHIPRSASLSPARARTRTEATTRHQFSILLLDHLSSSLLSFSQ